jgi:hypothetical protein
LLVIRIRRLKLPHGREEGVSGLDKLDGTLQKNYNGCQHGTQDRQQNEKATVEKQSLENLFD